MISVKNLTKKYSQEPVIRDISFSLGKGVYGFLGNNGAGKSTTLNIITGCLSATSGSVEINGYDILTHPLQAKSCMGYLPEVPPLYFNMTPFEQLSFAAELRGIPRADKSAEIKRAITDTGIGEVASRLIKNLSKGYKQRVGIAQAILGRPDVIILDEPISGLDPQQMLDIRELISSLGSEHTILMSSHLLAEISGICNYYLILSKGKLAAQGSIDDLNRKLSSGNTVVVAVSGDINAAGKVLGALPFVSSIKKQILSSESAKYTLKISNIQYNDAAVKVISALSPLRCSINSINSNTQNLEELFFGIVQDNYSSAE